MIKAFLFNEYGAAAIEYVVLASAAALVISVFFNNHADSALNVFSTLTFLISKISLMTPT